MKILLLVEPLIENYAPLPAAIQAQAKRVALADNLAVGGTTVSKGTMGEAVRYAHEHQVSLDLVIAPRGGQGPFDDAEIKIMEADLLEAQQLGVDGVILAGLTAQRKLDTEALRPLVAAAGGMTLILGTTWDQIRPQDRGAATDWLAQQGFEAVLSAGRPGADRHSDWLDSRRLLAAKAITLIPTNVNGTDIPALADQLQLHRFLGANVLTKP